jgi:hypothetical protein
LYENRVDILNHFEALSQAKIFNFKELFEIFRFGMEQFAFTDSNTIQLLLNFFKKVLAQGAQT